MSNDIDFLKWQGPSSVLCASVHPTSEKGTWILVAHGFTGQRMGPGYLFVKLGRALSAPGVSFFRFDFTGSGESGGTFPEMTMSTMVEDLLSAVELVNSRFSPDRLILLGHSLGGAVAALCAQQANADGLILLAPVSDPLGLTQRRKETVLKEGVNSNGYYENGPHEMSIEFLRDLQNHRPLEALTGWRGPIAVFQGDQDRSVSTGESGRYHTWAESAGVDREYHLLEGNDHNFSTVSGVQFLCTTIQKWLRRNFG